MMLTHFYSTTSNTLRHQSMILQILTAEDQVYPEISQWETARQTMKEKLSEGYKF